MASEGSGWHTFQIEEFEVLVGKGARENDRLTFREAAPNDLWLHAAGYAGSHVVIRNPEKLPLLPKSVVEQAAALAAHHSKARDAKGKIEVHVCRVSDVRKPHKAAPGKVELKRWDTVRVYARSAAKDEG